MKRADVTDQFSLGPTRFANKLILAPDLKLPADEAVTQKYGFIGRSGSGKSYGSMKLAELFLGAGAQIIALDWVGIWWSLRLAASGKAPGFEHVYIFGGEHADVPLEPTSGALIASGAEGHRRLDGREHGLRRRHDAGITWSAGRRRLGLVATVAARGQARAHRRADHLQRQLDADAAGQGHRAQAPRENGPRRDVGVAIELSEQGR